jgi:hypothetical protein
LKKEDKTGQQHEDGNQGYQKIFLFPHCELKELFNAVHARILTELPPFVKCARVPLLVIPCLFFRQRPATCGAFHGRNAETRTGTHLALAGRAHQHRQLLLCLRSLHPRKTATRLF